MEYELITPKKTFTFRETLSGTLDLVDIKSADNTESPGPVEEGTLSFNYEEINSWARLVIKAPQGSKRNQLRSQNLQFLVQGAKIYTFAASGIYYKAGAWIDHTIPENPCYLALMRAILGDEVAKGIFFEYGLGAFSPETLASRNIRGLISPFPDDIERVARRWFSEQKTIYTRVVGFGFRYERFAQIKEGAEELIIQVGRQATPLRESFNKNDPNAIAIVYENGEKLGYVRSTIASYLARVMDEGTVFSGKICGVLDEYRDDNERVYVEFKGLGF